MQYHAYLDRFTIIGRCVVAEGWANELDLELFYGGARLDISVAPVHRPDLVAIVGSGSEAWGFTLCAALPALDIDRTQFVLKFNAGITRSDPSSGFRAHDDRNFEAMVNRFRDIVAERKGRLLEIGSRARSGTTYRDWFPPDIGYSGIDISAGPNVDVVGDAHHLSRYFESRFDFVFSIAVFEHILMPWKVALEMNKILKPGGRALIISHAAWPLHEEPWDFFRFSKDAWRGIFNKHTGFTTIDTEYQFPASIVPDYASTVDFQQMSRGRTFLLSGCVVEKTGGAEVAWEAEVGDVYDLGYSHA